MDLDYFTRLRQGPVARLIRWLQHRSLLANPLHCSGCKRDMELVEHETGYVDGYQWFVSISFTIIIFFVPAFQETAAKALLWSVPEVFLDFFFRMRELSELTRDPPFFIASSVEKSRKNFCWTNTKFNIAWSTLVLRHQWARKFLRHVSFHFTLIKSLDARIIRDEIKGSKKVGAWESVQTKGCGDRESGDRRNDVDFLEG